MDQETGDLQEKAGLTRGFLGGRPKSLLLRAFVFVHDRLVNAEWVATRFAVVQLHIH